MDALAALSAGIEATSITPGVASWLPAWTAALYFRRVVICFDNGALMRARAVRDELLGAGVSARLVHLRRLGLKTPKGDVNDYLLSGGNPKRLLEGTK